MAPNDRWSRFARADASVLARAQSEALARYLREELAPFSRHYGHLFKSIGFDPRRSNAPADLTRVPPTEPSELVRAQGLMAHRTDFLLKPSAPALRREWSVSRKLALAFGGRRAQERLARTYTPCFQTRERIAGRWLFVHHTRFDLEVLGEHGARAFGFLGLDRPSERLLSLARPGPGIDRWALLQAGWQSGAAVEHDLDLDEPALVEAWEPTAVAGGTAEVLGFLAGARERGVALPGLKLALLLGAGTSMDEKRRVADHVAALGASEPVVCRGLTSSLARALFVEPPADVDAEPGFLLSPDLALFEVVRPGTGDPAPEGEGGELLLSSLAARGTAVLRYRIGLSVGGPIDRSRCAWSGLGLPRLPSDAAPSGPH